MRGYQMALCAGLFLAAQGGLSGTAEAGLSMCNDAAEEISVAIGYQDDSKIWTSEGWWRLLPGECKTVIGGDLKNRFIYYRATVPDGTFDGAYAFCTSPDIFTIVGDEECAARGFERSRFRQIDTGAEAVDVVHRLGPNDVALVTESVPTPAPTLRPAPVLRQAFSGLTAGAFGEPFEVQALFDGCEVIDGYDHCAFVAEGVRYVVGYDGPTPAAALDIMQNWPINMPTLLRGDILYFGDITIEFVLGEAVETPGADPYANVRALLQGDWINPETKAAGLFIHGSRAVETFAGAPVFDSLLQLSDACPDAPGLGIGFEQIELESRDSFCLILAEVTPQRILLTVPLRGTSVEWIRR